VRLGPLDPSTVSLVEDPAGRQAALRALWFPAGIPAVVAVCVGTSIAMSEAWPFAVAIPLVALLDRGSIRFVRAYVDEHGSSWGLYEPARPSYMRYWARRADVDWRVPAAVLWAGIALLAGFFIFLAGHAAWDLASMAIPG
jgi:hypothetical protein